MFLMVDNSLDDKCIIHFSSNDDWYTREFERDGRDLLENVDQLLKDERKNISDLEGLAVVIGKGKFTSTRVAVTMINTLSFALQIPVLPVDGFYEDIKKDIQKIPVGQYVSAQYSAPANIGNVKK